jgi:hypothetical protein
MTPEFWKRWHVKVMTANPKSLQPVKAYKLAHTILNSAVADRRIAIHPWVVKWAPATPAPVRTLRRPDGMHSTDVVRPNDLHGPCETTARTKRTKKRDAVERVTRRSLHLLAMGDQLR